ncbi:hypothetical protein JCM11641_005948 [Rhodosporidiobolus odoratus]
MSTSSQGPLSTMPPTLLPSDPKSLARYLRSRQLASLRHLYEYKSLLVSQQFEEHAASLRGRHGRVRRRRGSSPLEPERDEKLEDEADDLEVRKRMRWDPVSDEEEQLDGIVMQAEEQADPPKPSKTPRQPRQYSESAVDPAHAYDLAFDLAPDSFADAYYHGPHPPPPSRVVRTLLRASRKRPFVDPEGLASAQLQALTLRLWEEEGQGLSVLQGGTQEGEPQLSRDQERLQKELDAEAADEWEASVIAGFSATCDEKIGKAMARRPMTAREMQQQALAHAQAAAAAAAQQQPAASHPQVAYAAPQLSPFGDRGFAAQQAAPAYWR